MIRTLRPDDAAALSRFFEENNLPDVTRAFHPFPLDATTADRLCHNPGSDLYFAEFEQGVIVGFGMLRGWNEGYPIPSFGLLVDHRAGGRGIGSMLTAFAIQRARSLNAPAVRLTVHAENLRAIGIYARAGFQHTETVPDGRYVMRLELS